MVVCNPKRDVVVFLTAAERPILIGLLLPMTGTWQGGLNIAGAAALAVERVNQRADLLPGSVVKYCWADSGCSGSQALRALGTLLAEGLHVVIGPGCSDACRVTAFLSEGRGVPQIRFANVYTHAYTDTYTHARSWWTCACLYAHTRVMDVVCSYSCALPSLSNKKLFPLFSRTVAPDTEWGPCLIALAQKFRWKNAAMLTSSTTVWYQTGVSLARQLKAAGMNMLTLTIDSDSIGQVIIGVRRSGIRCVFVFAYEDDVEKFSLAAGKPF